MIKISRVIFAESVAPAGSDRGHYHRLSMSIGRVHGDEQAVVEGAEYEIDGERVSAEEFRDVLRLLSLPAIRP